MILDNYLSPLTSYPANSPKSLIFSRPFQRIYDDVFLLDETDFHKFVYRAYFIYDRFIDICLNSLMETTKQKAVSIRLQKNSYFTGMLAVLPLMRFSNIYTDFIIIKELDLANIT
jgi:hypothetical protein